MLRWRRLELPRSGAYALHRHRKRAFFEIVAFAVGPGDSSDPAGWPTLPIARAICARNSAAMGVQDRDRFGPLVPRRASH